MKPKTRAKPPETLACEEGCGCRFSRERAYVLSVDGEEHFFCCSDCKDAFLKTLTPAVTLVIREYVQEGMTVADIGCGTGVYTELLARQVGPRGRVFATDLNPAFVRRIRQTLGRSRRFPGILARSTSAGDLGFIADASLDFLLSNQVLCCVPHRDLAVQEIHRTLKPGGTAYIRISRIRVEGVPPVTPGEWERILSGFQVRERGSKGKLRWALLSQGP